MLTQHATLQYSRKMAQSEQKCIDSIASHLHACVIVREFSGSRRFAEKKTFIDTSPQYPATDASSALPQTRINVALEKITAAPAHVRNRLCTKRHFKCSIKIERKMTPPRLRKLKENTV